MIKNLQPKKIDINTFQKYRTTWKKAENAKFLSDFPLHIDIELTSDCNLKCKMCWQNKEPDAFSKGMMKENLFKKIIDEGVKNGLCAIKIQSRGEAMMHPRIFKYSRYAKDRGIMDIHLTTNGTLFLKKGKINELFNSGIDKLIFSIDYAHDESIEEIYKKKKPDIRKYFNEIAKIKKEKNLTKPYLVIQTFCKDGQKKNELRKNLTKKFPLANFFNINELWNSTPEEESIKNLKTDYDFLPCAYLWSRILVHWDGKVIPCCRDYSGKYLQVGDTNKQSIKQIWISKKMMNFRKLHVEKKRSKINICANCDVSTAKKKNKN